jgi:hypothetical protein
VGKERSITYCVCVCSYPSCKAHAPYWHLWSVWLHHIFLHYVTNGTIFGKRLIEHKMCVLIFSTNLSETLFAFKIIQRDIVINALRLHVKYSLFLSHFNEACILAECFIKKKVLISDFMKIRSVGAEFHADGRTGTCMAVICSSSAA